MNLLDSHQGKWVPIPATDGLAEERSVGYHGLSPVRNREPEIEIQSLISVATVCRGLSAGARAEAVDKPSQLGVLHGRPARNPNNLQAVRAPHAMDRASLGRNVSAALRFAGLHPRAFRPSTRTRFALSWRPLTFLRDRIVSGRRHMRLLYGRLGRWLCAATRVKKDFADMGPLSSGPAQEA